MLDSEVSGEGAARPASLTCRWALPCIKAATCQAQLREGHSNRASLESSVSFAPLLQFQLVRQLQ